LELSRPLVTAAGGIVVRGGATGIELALVYRSSRLDWGFPKGKLEPGETELSCARREVEEETGLLCNVGEYVGHTSYVDRRNRPKVVHYWMMEPVGGEFAVSDEVDDMQWVSIELTHLVLTYEHDRELMTRAIAPAIAARAAAARP